MRLTRRQLLISAPAALVACANTGDSGKAPDTGGVTATPVRPAEPAEWEPGGAEDPSVFTWGLQSGDPTPTSIVLSVRTTEPLLTVRVVRQAGEAWEAHGEYALELDGEVAQLTLTDLSPDVAYRWVVETANGARTRVGRFRSAPDAAFRVVTVGATSCLRGNQPWPNLSFAAAEDFDVFLFLGDTVYVDGPTLEAYRAGWRASMAEEGLKAVTARAPMIATWDDHEVGNNWSMAGLAEGQFDAALQAFRESMPQGVGPSGGIWRTLGWGGVVDFFVLDCRSEREGDRYMSDEQMSWLKASLSASTARFKLILNSVPITDFSDMFGEVEVQDRWQGFPAQRAEILGWIAEEGIGGVLWLAGDLHYGQVSKLDVPGSGGPGEAQWEVLAGPGGSEINPLAPLFQDATGQYPVLVAAWNYVRLTLDPGVGSVGVAFIGDDGGVISEITLAV